MAMKLQDEKLFRQHCYIDGEWVDAIEPRDDPGQQPGDRRDARHRAEAGRRGDPPRDRGGRPRACRRGARKTAKERAQILRNWFDLMMANQDDLAR